MSRSSAPVLALLLSLLLLSLGAVYATKPAANSTTADSSCSLRSCAALDMTLLREYVSGLNVSGNDSVATTTSNIETLPFGALDSDWTRLLLLFQNRQPRDASRRDNLVRLSRLMLAAYFDTDDEDTLEVVGNAAGGDRPNNNQHHDNNDESKGEAEIESQDQQATTNVTLGSAGQKESTWINAGADKTTTTTTTSIHEDEAATVATQSSGESSAGNVIATTTANFNRTLAFANETEAGSNRANNASSDEANEALRERSREIFLKGRRRAKANKKKSIGAGDDDVDGEEEKGAEALFVSREEDDDATMVEKGGESPKGEFNSTKSIEELLELEDPNMETTTNLIYETFENEETTIANPSTVESFDQINHTEDSRGDNNESTFTPSIDVFFDETNEDEDSNRTSTTATFVTLLPIIEDETTTTIASLTEETITEQIKVNSSDELTDQDEPTTNVGDEIATSSSIGNGTVERLVVGVQEKEEEEPSYDLFRNESTGRDDWSATTTTTVEGSIDDDDFSSSASSSFYFSSSSREARQISTQPLLRRMLMNFRHEVTSNASLIASGKLIEPETSNSSGSSARELNGSSVSGEKQMLDLELTSRSKRYRRNKRSMRERKRYRRF